MVINGVLAIKEGNLLVVPEYQVVEAFRVFRMVVIKGLLEEARMVLLVEGILALLVGGHPGGHGGGFPGAGFPGGDFPGGFPGGGPGFPNGGGGFPGRTSWRR